MANLEVNLIGDSRSLERAFDRSARSARKFEAQVTGVGSSLRRGFAGAAAAVGVGFGLSTLVDGLAGAVKAASNLNESISKTDAVFGRSAAAVETWSTTTSRAFGVSQREALETASSFGALFAPLGIVGDTAAEQSRRLTELGADLASFYNTDVTSALDAIRSGLVGESEPLRRYGALLTETRVTEEALSQTHKKHASDLTAQEKVLARVALIYRDTAQAQGDFARTSTGLAAQQKILGAQIDDLQAKLGQVLLPEVTKVVTKMNNWLAVTENQDKLLGGFTTTVNTTATAFYNLAAAVTAAANAYQNLNEQAGKVEGFLDRIGAGINRETLFRVVPGSELIFQGAAALLKDRGGGPRGGGTLTGGTALSPDTQEAARAAVRQAQAAVKKIVGEETKKQPRGVTAAQRNAWFDAMISRQLGRVQDITSVRGQIARLGVIAGLIRDRLAVTKDITRRLSLEDDLVAVLRAQRAARGQRADEVKRLALDARNERMGWIDFAIERAAATKSSRDDRRRLREKEKFLKGLIAHEGRTLELVSELWRTRQRIRDLNKKNAAGDPLAGLMQVSSKRLANMLAAGTGLDVAGRRRLGANIAGAEIQPLHIHVEIDGREVGRAVSRDQARTGRRTARQTSGFRG